MVLIRNNQKTGNTALCNLLGEDGVEQWTFAVGTVDDLRRFGDCIVIAVSCCCWSTDVSLQLYLTSANRALHMAL